LGHEKVRENLEVREEVRNGHENNTGKNGSLCLFNYPKKLLNQLYAYEKIIYRNIFFLFLFKITAYKFKKFLPMINLHHSLAYLWLGKH